MNNYKNNKENTQDIFVLPWAKYKIDQRDITQYTTAYWLYLSIRKDILNQILEIKKYNPNKIVRVITQEYTKTIKTAVKNILIEK